MKIYKLVSQTRRDFVAVMQCEFCNATQMDNSGYDDRYYHDNVIPEMKCDKCGKATKSEGGQIEHTPTKYPDGFTV
jgi:Zn ribbon nucleic-acid-binding protein